MRLGKKMYFDSSGKVIFIRGEMVGSVSETEKENDILNYGLPQDVMLKILEVGELQSELKDAGTVWVINDKIKIYPKLSIEADKPQITSSGTDISNITIKCVDGSYNGICDISVNGEVVQSLNFNKGLISIPFNSSVSGDYYISAENELYGTNTVKIEVL